MAEGIERRNRGIDRQSDVAIKAFIRKWKPGNTKKLMDGRGLYLMVTPAGTPVWRVKYRHDGKERTYAVGIYPEITLAAARAERDRVRVQVKEGQDPVVMRKVQRAQAAGDAVVTFAGVAEDWLNKQHIGWSEIHYLKSQQALERDVFPKLGALPITSIDSKMIADAIQKVIDRGAVETASKILWNVSCVFRFAQAKGLCPTNPAEPVKEILPKQVSTRPRAALLTFEALGDVLRRADAANISPAVRLANRLCAFTAARLGNVLTATWDEFDLDAEQPVWIIPRRQMKMKDRQHDHRIVLGPSVAAELRHWRRVTDGEGYVFASKESKTGHITHEAVEKVYRVTLQLSGTHSPHGWRASFATLAKDTGFSRDVVELALDHVHDNDVVRAYDRGERWEERIKLVYWWDSNLTAAQYGGEVIPLRGKVSVQ